MKRKIYELLQEDNYLVCVDFIRTNYNTLFLIDKEELYKLLKHMYTLRDDVRIILIMQYLNLGTNKLFLYEELSKCFAEGVVFTIAIDMINKYILLEVDETNIKDMERAKTLKSNYEEKIEKEGDQTCEEIVIREEEDIEIWGLRFFVGGQIEKVIGDEEFTIESDEISGTSEIGTFEKDQPEKSLSMWENCVSETINGYRNGENKDAYHADTEKILPSNPEGGAIFIEAEEQVHTQIKEESFDPKMEEEQPIKTDEINFIDREERVCTDINGDDPVGSNEDGPMESANNFYMDTEDPVTTNMNEKSYNSEIVNTENKDSVFKDGLLDIEETSNSLKIMKTREFNKKEEDIFKKQKFLNILSVKNKSSKNDDLVLSKFCNKKLKLFPCKKLREENNKIKFDNEKCTKIIEGSTVYLKTSKKIFKLSKLTLENYLFVSSNVEKFVKFSIVNFNNKYFYVSEYKKPVRIVKQKNISENLKTFQNFLRIAKFLVKKKFLVNNPLKDSLYFYKKKKFLLNCFDLDSLNCYNLYIQVVELIYTLSRNCQIPNIKTLNFEKTNKYNKFMRHEILNLIKTYMQKIKEKELFQVVFN